MKLPMEVRMAKGVPKDRCFHGRPPVWSLPCIIEPRTVFCGHVHPVASVSILAPSQEKREKPFAIAGINRHESAKKAGELKTNMRIPNFSGYDGMEIC